MLFSCLLTSTNPRPSKWETYFQRDMLRHAVIGFGGNREGKLSTRFVSTPPPCFILQALFVFSPHLPFAQTHLRASQWTDVISGASRGHRWTPASVSLHRSARDTPLCTTVTCRTSQIQATEKSGYNDHICVCAFTIACLTTCTSRKEPRGEYCRGRGRLAEPGWKTWKMLFQVQFVSVSAQEEVIYDDTDVGIEGLKRTMGLTQKRMGSGWCWSMWLFWSVLNL